MEVAGSAVGIASLGIQTCQALLSYYDTWKDYKSDIGSAYGSIADLGRTLILLKDSLNRGDLDQARVERVQRCLQSCETGLIKLSEKLQKLRKSSLPAGWRQKAVSELQRAWYPFRAGTLSKLQGNVASVQDRLKLAIEVLKLDISVDSRDTLSVVEERLTAIEASVAQVSTHNEHLLAAQRRESLIGWLSPPDPWTNHNSARQRHEPETGTWLLQSDLYQKWKTGAIDHIWTYGKAGCGKTVLCSTAIEDVRAHCETEPELGFAVFYFSFSDSQKKSFQDLLRSLIAQLGWKEPGLSTLQHAYDKFNRSVQSTEELEKVLLSCVDSYDDVFLLLDALDECPEDGEVRENMLKGLKRLTERAPNLKIFATSRELRDVRDWMVTLKAEPISIATSAVNADSLRYMSAELSHDRRLSRLDTKSKTMIEETISQKADGM